MLHEHGLGRSYIRGMNDAVGSAAAGDVPACTKFVDNAGAYVDLLREHIQKEDHGLYGMANQAFFESDQQKLLDAFAHVEAEELGTGTHEKYLNLANELTERWNVPKAEVTIPCHHACGCGH